MVQWFKKWRILHHHELVLNLPVGSSYLLLTGAPTANITPYPSGLSGALVSQAQYGLGSGQGQEMWWCSYSQGKPMSQCHLEVSSSKSKVQQKCCASRLTWSRCVKMSVIWSLCFSSRCNLRCPCFSHVCLKFPCMGIEGNMVFVTQSF